MKWYHYVLLAIVAFAFVIRVVGLSNFPPSLNWDEVSHGYNAYSILTTGSDEWGQPFPSIFRAFGDYKLPVYVYLTAASEALFGANDTAVRLPSAVAGTMAVFGTYFLVTTLFANKNKEALLASLLLAISPWSFFMSRVALEANVALALIIAGAVFALRGIHKKNWEILPGAVLFGASAWTYNSARVFVPILIVSIFLIYSKDLKALLKSKKGIGVGSVVILGIFLLPMFFQLLNTQGSARYMNVKILDQGAINYIEEKRNTTALPTFLGKAMYNKPVYLSTEFAKNYLSHLSPSFFYASGQDSSHFSVKNHSLLFSVNAVFFLSGLILLVKSPRKKSHQLVFAWLLVAPIAASITRESPHALRAITILPIPMILSSLGLFWILSAKKVEKFKHVLLLLYLLGIVLVFGKYLSSYFSEYPNVNSFSWQYGYSEVVDYVKSSYNDYDKIIVTKKYGEPHEFFLFYGLPNPPWDSSRDTIKFYQTNWWWVDRIDNLYFVNDWDIPESGGSFILESGQVAECTEKCLLVASPGNYPEDWKMLQTVYFLNGEPAFEILEK